MTIDVNNDVHRCGNCQYAFPRCDYDLARYGDPHKYLECTATDKTLNIYKDKDDICDKGKFKEKKR